MSGARGSATPRRNGRPPGLAVELAFLTSIAICAMAVTVACFGWDFDDSFIVYRYARNLLAGDGWRFNPGESVNASTSVLNTLAIALATLPGGDPRAAAHLLGGLWLLAAGVLTYRIFSPCFGRAYAAAAALPLVLHLGFNNTWGLEINLFIALCLLFVHLEQRRRRTWYLLGFILLARPEGGILLVGKTLVEVIRHRRLPLAGLARTGLVLLPWLAFSLYSFGSVLPATLAQKVWQGRSGLWGEQVLYRKHLASLQWQWWIAAPALLGVARMLLERSALLYLVAFALLQQAVYLALGLPAYHWYTAFLRFAFHLSALYGLGAALGYAGFLLVRAVARLRGSARISAAFEPVAAGILLAVSLLACSRVMASPPAVHANLEPYRKLSEQINREVPPGALAALEVGIVAYYTNREILDLTGLTSASGEFITGAGNDRFFELRPRVVVVHDRAWNMEEAILRDRRFPQHYRLGGVVRSPAYQDLLYYVLR
jgi:hypothetical protein